MYALNLNYQTSGENIFIYFLFASLFFFMLA
jgi:hypothetical protein